MTIDKIPQYAHVPVPREFAANDRLTYHWTVQDLTRDGYERAADKDVEGYHAFVRLIDAPDPDPDETIEVNKAHYERLWAYAHHFAGPQSPTDIAINYTGRSAVVFGQEAERLLNDIRMHRDVL